MDGHIYHLENRGDLCKNREIKHFIRPQKISMTSND